MKQLSAKRPLLLPEDAKGLKFRIQESDVLQVQFETLGAVPQKMAFAEVYGALQQGVVDAQENPLPTIQAKKFYEVQKYINLTQHIINNLLTIISASTWQKLTPDEKKIFEEVTVEAARQCSNAIRKAEDDLLPWFEKQGNIINKVDRKPFIDAVAPSLKSSPRMTWTLAQYEKMQALKP
jgi:TRAP-type C4-dicarboxylate transport system substrate-binding protein